MTAEQLVEKRGRRSGAISGLRPETEVGRFLVKLAEKNLTVLQTAEDALIGVGGLIRQAGQRSRSVPSSCGRR